MSNGTPKPIPAISEQDAARFMRKIDARGADDCWPWLGGVNCNGYGRINIGGDMYLAPRIALTLDGRNPGSLIARHKCDNPPCCNPSHLDTGTHADNIRDKVERGRAPRGDANGSRTHPECRARGGAHGMSKLTEADIRAIRADPRSLSAIAKEYSVHFQQISRVKRRETWAHVA